MMSQTSAAPQPAATTPRRRPNVVFVLTDDQGFGEIGRHGNRVIQTPCLDRLHDESVRFNRFLVSPTCAPTRAALMTGRHEFRGRVSHTILGRSILREDAFTLPEMFRGAGYRTALFGKWHLGDNYPCRPQDRGFEEALYHGGGGMTQTPDYWGNSYFDATYHHNGKWEECGGYCTDVYFEHATAWINQHRDEPFFCYIPTNAPHRPLQVEQRYADLYADDAVDDNAKRFYGMISNIDENVGRLVDQLTEWGLADDTLVIFMPDNGSAEAGNPRRGLWNAGMRGGKGTPYEGGVRVPCFFRWPAAFGAGREVDHLTAHIDFLPTLAELVGGEIPTEADIDGRSMVPLLREPEAAWPDRMLATHVGRWGTDDAPNDWKLKGCSVRSSRYRWVGGRELYDLQADPGETRNVIEQHPDVAIEMSAWYDQWWEKVLPEVTVASRLHLGHPAENPSTLTCHDWMESQRTQGEPQRLLAIWQQQCLRVLASGAAWDDQKAPKQYGMMGAWAVAVDFGGTYRITLRKLPEAADVELRKLQVGEAHVQVGEVHGRAPLTAGQTEAVIELALPAGDCWLEAWFTGQRSDGKEAGAFFVEVERV